MKPHGTYHPPEGWVKFETLEPGDTFHDIGAGGRVIQYIKTKLVLGAIDVRNGPIYNSVDLDTGRHFQIAADEFVFPVKAGWLAELACYGFVIPKKVQEEGHREIIAYVMSHTEARKANDNWRKEIEKYLPQLGFMSFGGAERTIRWLMDHVEIKSEHDALTNKLKAIRDSDLPDEQKATERIETMFPKLKGSRNEPGHRKGSGEES